MDKHSLMQNLAREANEKGLFTGAWLFAENGEIVSQGAVGFRDAADTLPVQPESVFDLASVSKNFTASAIMLLRRRGLLSLEDELTKFLPELPFPGVTVRHLLTHTSGLPDYMKWVDRLARREGTIPPNSAVIRFLKESGAKARFAPGEKFEYCNTAYCVLAEIVAKLSGEKFEDFMRDNIFEPAGMHATRIRHPRKEGADFPNYARAMVPIDGKFVLPEDADRYDYVTTLDGAVGDGYVYASAPDLLAWDQALRAGTVLTQEEQELMITPATLKNGERASDGDDYGYGFGWYLFESPEIGRVISHSGGWPGVSTWYGRYLDKNRVLVLLSCRDAVDARGGDAFFQSISAIGRGTRPTRTTTASKRST